MAGVLGRSGQGPAEGCGYNDGVRVAARDVGDRIGSDYLGGMMLYKSLTQTERIAWDLAEPMRWPTHHSVMGGAQVFCPFCRAAVISQELHKLDLAEAHKATCPYRRAVEWKAEKVARWEAER